MEIVQVDPRLIERNVDIVQAEFDPESLRYEGYSVWGIVRSLLSGLHLWALDENGMRSSGIKTNPITSKGGGVKKNKMFVRDSRDYFLASSRRESLNKHYDVLFVESLDALSLNENGVVINRVFNELQNELSGFSCLRFFPYDNLFRGLDITGDVVLYKKVFERFLATNYKKNNIAGLKELFWFIRDKGILFPFSYDYLDRLIKSIFIRSAVFIEIFKAFRPKLVVLTSFYSSERIAQVLACKELGIKTLDVQHGILGPNYYNLLTGDDCNELLPDFFWLWGKSSAEYIKPNYSERSPNLLVGGNLALFKQEMNQSGDEDQAKNILIIEQYTHNHTVKMIDKIVKDIMLKGLDEEMFLSLRLHPRSHHMMEFYKNKYSLCNFFDVEGATKGSLYSQLKKATVTVVESSTVAHEAKFFGSNVLIYGENGLKYFSDYIDGGKFNYVSSFYDILDAAIKLEMNEGRCEADFYLFDKEVSRMQVSFLKENILSK